MNKKQLKIFFNLLEEKCDFQYKIPNDPTSITWLCKGDLSFAEEILDKMGIDKKEKLDLLDACKFYGGYCDCEILFNAMEQILKHYPNYKIKN